MAIQKNQGIIIKTQLFRSTSLIVTFFTRDFGKIRGLVKGVRQAGETRGALYELFTCLEIVYYEKTRSDLHLVSEAFMLENYSSLRSQLGSIAYASYFSELADELTEVHDPHGKIFDLLHFCFRYLPSLSGPRIARIFEIKLLSEIGWLPYLDRCLGCSNPHLEEGFFSPRQGALLCPACAKRYGDVFRIQREALAAMRYYARHDLEMSSRFWITDRTSTELETLIERFLLERIQKPLKSTLFLKKLKQTIEKQQRF
ncbi:MAG: DNA repair protein RecO [Aquabacterium sp.]|uniref:DNA repair protein RecO n=1 Tax=Aquabacterium sp. TaxID=1872578 RepID=UPI003BAEFDB0